MIKLKSVQEILESKLNEGIQYENLQQLVGTLDQISNRLSQWSRKINKIDNFTKEIKSINAKLNEVASDIEELSIEVGMAEDSAEY